jgi:N-acetylmuramoyl-L-alanine amidase
LKRIILTTGVVLAATLMLSGQSAPTRTYEIFGPKYEKVTISSNELEGAIFYLVAGHGGPDPGAQGKYGNYTLSEDEYAYDVTLRLARNLIEKGALVYMITRDNNDGIRDESILRSDKDEKCYPNQEIPLNQLARLSQRTKAVNELYRKNKSSYQRVIIIHLDSRSMGEKTDVFFYHHNRSKSGKRLALSIQQTFKEKYDHHQPNRGYSGTVSDRSGLYVIRNTKPPAVFIELGNIRNSRDQRRFVVRDNREALAKWMTEAIVNDYTGK